MFRWISDFRGLGTMDQGGRQFDRFFLWVDAVGGYWVCLGDEITLGQPGPASAADVPILGDLSNRHAIIRRDGEGYLIKALRSVRVDGREVNGESLLTGNHLVQLGGGVRLKFCRPHALSATARLDFLSPHRTQPTVDAVILMADTCVLGPRPHSHVVCRTWPEEVVLYRHEEQLYCRAKGSLEIDGVTCQGRGRLSTDSRVVGPWFSLGLEAMGGRGERRMGS